MGPVQPVVAAGALPSLGDGAQWPIGAERRLGDAIVRDLYRDPDYLDDPLLTEYVQGIWQPLLAAARARGDLSPELSDRFAWVILMGRDRSVNAFALPGGYFGLHLGLLAVVTRADELASVLSHELSHVTQRHIARLIGRQEQQTPWVIGAMVLGALAASKSPDSANALLVGSRAVAAQSQLNFSRDMEREADRLGLGVLLEAGFDGRGFVTMFDKLQQASRLNDNSAYPYLRSHPLTTERIADLQTRQPQTAPPIVPPVLEQALASMRARVLAETGVDGLLARRQEADAAGFSGWDSLRQAVALYGAALAAQRLRDPLAARAYRNRLEPLVRDDEAGRRWFALLGLEAAVSAGGTSLALALPTDWTGTAAAGLRRPELLLLAAVAQQTDRADLRSSALQALQG
ncbi:MAG: peptidase M48, partial [Rhodoferax sp.]|nr:peptidase M48 [Rhodoferax sp.]